MTIHIRNLSPSPATVDTGARTVEAIVSTGADTPRGGFIERLDLPGADLSRLIGAPVLDAHRSASTRDQLGIVEATELRPEGIWVRMKFRSNTAAEAVLSDIEDGTLRGLSIGYTVTRWKEMRDGNRRIRVAEEWTPLEVSIVPVPADPGAHFRAGGSEMPETQEQVAEDTAVATQDPPAMSTRGASNAEIRTIAETAGLTRGWADAQIDAEVTPDEARRAAFEAMQTRSAQTTTRTTRATIGTDHTDPMVIATRAGEALYARSHPGHELPDAARPFAAMSTIDLARDCLTRSGIRTTGLAADTVVTRALHTTSDFPLILGDTVGRELRRGYEMAPSGVRQVARQSTARDFRAKRSIQLGEGDTLSKVNEGGEFKYTTLNEAAESYHLETFGKIISISRQALINDDLGAFTQLSSRMGQAAKNFECAELVKMITKNPAMSDGFAVFGDEHENVGLSGGGVTTGTLSHARNAMWRQKGLSGHVIGVAPRFILTPPEYQTEAEQAVANITATQTSDANPFEALTVLVDPRLPEAGGWYVVADPAQIDGLEYAYLEGAPGPQIETQAGFDVDGMRIKVRLDFGTGWIDHRGWYKNLG